MAEPALVIFQVLVTTSTISIKFLRPLKCSKRGSLIDGDSMKDVLAAIAFDTASVSSQANVPP